MAEPGKDPAGASGAEDLVFVFACLAFAAVAAANIQQERTRNTLATYGVLPQM